MGRFRRILSASVLVLAIAACTAIPSNLQQHTETPPAAADSPIPPAATKTPTLPAVTETAPPAATETPALSDILTPTHSLDGWTVISDYLSKYASPDKADYVSFLTDEITGLLCEIHYALTAWQPMDGVSDEQKIVFGLVMNGAKDETLLSTYEPEHIKADTFISAEDVDRIVNEYFYHGISEHKSVSGYIDAEYVDGVYRVTYGQPIGVSIYSLQSVAALPLTEDDLSGWYRGWWTGAPEDVDVVICTADLILVDSTHTSIVGKSIITLAEVDNTYKIYDYREELLSDYIKIFTTYP